MKLKAKIIRNQSGTPCFQVTYKEKPYRVKMFKFQESSPDGVEIDCIVTTQANGEDYLRQNLPKLLREYYKPGEEYEFEVKHDFTHNGYYELLDPRGIPFRLPVPKGVKLLTGSTVRCRLERIDHSGGQLRLTDADEMVIERPSYQIPEKGQGERPKKTELDADTIAEAVETDFFEDELPDWDIEALFSLLFINADYYASAVDDGLLEQIRRWSGEGLDWEAIHARLDEMRKAIMYVLEGSTLLLTIEPLRRKSLQHRLSVMADSVSGYRRAAGYLRSGESEAKTDRVLHSLSTSGFIYEAEKQLDMLRRLFSLSTEFMRDKMADVLSIIHRRSEDFWRDEPFRKAFIRLLQLYVEQCRRGIEDTGTGGESGVRPLLEALAIQLLLADPEGDADVFDYNLNLAMMYRYAAALRTSVPANAAHNAFMALMDVTRRPSAVYAWSDTGAHDLLASKLTVAQVGKGTPFRKWYTNRQVQLSLSESGWTISRSDVARDSLKSLDLSGLGIWHNLQILTPQRIASVTGSNDLNRARTMWQTIENSLFSQEENVKRPLPRRLATPGRDDTCTIFVTGQIDEGVFSVEVHDSVFEGRGIIRTEDMVKYKIPQLGVEQFRDKAGNPYLMLAKVKKVEDDVIHFTMLDFMVEYVHECVENDHEMICVIKSKNQFGCVGVSEQGDSVRFKPDGISTTVKIGDQVRGNWWQRPDRPGEHYIDGVVTEVIEDPKPFSTEGAFGRLVADYSGHETYHEERRTEAEGGDTADGEELLPDSRLKELMAVIERRAAAESDYMKAFNHIGLARLLARMGRDDRRREFYEAWMRLISLLHYFAINGEIDSEQMADFEENDRSRFDERSELYRRYVQLKIVSFKGRPDRQAELWGYMADSDEEIRALASNVMAYNLVAQDGSASMLGEISDRINNLLKVKTRTSTLHSFGSENKMTEFKTSLVYPPNNNMRPDLDTQTLEIMKELCALLNADGGTLYIGVNDFGMGVGAENDIAFFKGSEDKMDLHVRHAVCRTMGNDVDAHVDGHFETFGGKRIYVLKVKPYYTAPVKVEGIIYERHGSSKLPFRLAEDIRLFTERRAQERDRILTATMEKKRKETEALAASRKAEAEVKALPAAVPLEKAELAEPAAKGAAKPAAKPAKEAPAKEPEPAEVVENPEKIATRTGRGVCPASFDEDSDPATVRYLQIFKDSFQLQPDFWGYGEDEDLLLSLPIREEDAQNWLVLGYADGTVCRVPMRTVLDKEDYTSGRRYTDSELVFADILEEGDALLTLSEGRKGQLYARADNVEALPPVSGMREAGDKIFNSNQAAYRYDALVGPKKLNYTDIFGFGYRDSGRFYTRTKSDQLYQQLQRDGID